MSIAHRPRAQEVCAACLTIIKLICTTCATLVFCPHNTPLDRLPEARYRIFFVSTRTISRDLETLRRAQPDVPIPLRSMLHDIGPVLTHRSRGPTIPYSRARRDKD